MKDLNIFITIMGHPNFRGGGNTAAHNFAETFAKLGYNVTALFLSPKKFLRILPKTSYRLVLLKDSRIPFFNCFRVAIALRKIISFSPTQKNIIISFGYEGFLVPKKGSVFVAASLAPLLRHISFKELFSDWRYFLPTNLGKWFFLLSCYFDRLTKLKADFVQCLCESSAEECHAIYKIPVKRIFTVPLGVDIKKFTLGPRTKERTILFAGGSAEYKGLDILLKALPAIIKKHPNARLTVIGEMSPKRTKELLNIAEELCVFSNIDWLGLASQEEMAGFYKKSYVLALPSRAESFLLAAIEGMSCGIPIVATPVGIIPEIIVHGVNGFIMRPEDPKSLSEVIIKLFDNPQKAETLGKAGRKTVGDKFAWEKIGKQYAMELKKLI